MLQMTLKQYSQSLYYEVLTLKIKNIKLNVCLNGKENDK